MGIYSLTESAMAGLNIAQAGILTTSQNVAGTSVEGYSRRNANVIMDSLAPNSLMLNGSSFAVEGFTRHYSSLVGSQLLIQQSKSSYTDTLVQYTNSIDSLVADKSTGLNTAISNFFNSMGAYAADPSNKALAGAITGTSKEVAQRMTGMSSMVTQIQNDARNALTDTVAQVNTLLPALADINQKIIDGNSPGVSAPSADLLDERDRLLAQLQQLVGGQSLINSNGTATQLVSGMPLVERSIANKVSINADQEHVALTFNLQNGPNKGVLATVQSLDGGQAGALLELSNRFVPSIQKRLDTIAMGLVKVANSAAQTSPGLATSLAIFGFKVADKTFSSLGPNDMTGRLPTIENENDLFDLYSSLGNAISSDSAVKVGTRVGTYTNVSSLTASTSTEAGDYTLTKVGTNQLKISDAFGKTQTVSLAASASGGLQTVDFNQLGITLQLENFSPTLTALSPLSGTPTTVNTTNGSNGLTGVTETAAIRIGAGGLASGESLTIAGLTFTATTTVTQAQLGAAFANLASGAIGASAANAAATALLGTYSGSLVGFSTGALSVNNVITATSITANQNVGNVAITVSGSGVGAPSTVQITNGSVIPPVTETAAITIGAGGLRIGQSLTIANLTFTATAAVTQAQLGAAFENLASGAIGASAANAAATALLGTYSGSLVGFNTGALSGSNVITATSTMANLDVGNLTIAVNGSGVGVPSSVQITDGLNIPAGTETAAITIGAGGLTAGQSLEIAGLTFTATTTVTQAQLGAAFENLTSGAIGASAANAAATALLGRYSGALTGFNTGPLTGSVITATSTQTLTDVTNITVTTQGNSVIKENTSLPIGGPASQIISNLVLQNNVQPAELNFTSVGNQLTLTSVNGGSQTITVLPGIAAGQSFDFDQMGISFSVRDISSPSKTAAEIASYFSGIRVSTGDIQSGTTLPAVSPTQSISNMVVQGFVKAGAFTFSANGSNLTLSNGNGRSQTVSVAAGFAGGQTLNFDQLGISFLVSDTSLPVQTAATIASYFDTKVIQVSAAITVEKTEDSAATIATALDGLKVKVSGMVNPLVNYGLSAANFISLAPTNFASYFNGITPLISSIKANATQRMGAVFGSSISNLVNEVGVQVASWKNSQKADKVVLANLKAQRDSVSGVNLDEEAANLLKYQQLYTASTKVLQAGNQMFSTLLSIMN